MTAEERTGCWLRLSSVYNEKDEKMVVLLHEEYEWGADSKHMYASDGL